MPAHVEYSRLGAGAGGGTGAAMSGASGLAFHTRRSTQRQLACSGRAAALCHQQRAAGAHPTGSGFVGMSSVSLANMAESARKPLARLMSDTCVASEGRGGGADFEGQLPGWVRGREAAGRAAGGRHQGRLTVTLYLTARPASVSCLVSCSG